MLGLIKKRISGKLKINYLYVILQIVCNIVVMGFFYNDLHSRYLAKVEANEAGINENVEPVFIKFISGNSYGKDLSKPMGVTVANDRIYVSDTNNRRIQIYNYEGTPLKAFGIWGSEPGQFQFPYGINADSKGILYIADLRNGMVSKFDKDGRYLGLFGEKSPSDNVFSAPAGLAVKNDIVYITDVKQNSLKIFDLQGKLIKQIGAPGINSGQFFAPNAVTVDDYGNIYVSDSGNQRIQIFDKNGKFDGIIKGSSGSYGKADFVNPRGIAVDGNTIYVVSNLSNRLVAFDKSGYQIFSFGGQGSGKKEFILPNGLYVDKNRRLYVTDTINQRISVFQL